MNKKGNGNIFAFIILLIIIFIFISATLYQRYKNKECTELYLYEKEQIDELSCVWQLHNTCHCEIYTCNSKVCTFENNIYFKIKT